MEKKDLVEGMRLYIYKLRVDGRYSTAKSYQDALNSFMRFCGLEVIPYIYVNKENLRRYQAFLLNKGCTWNTVSTYMRRIRCVYNMAVEEGLAPYIPYLFKGVFTGIESKRKKALPQDLLRSLMTASLDDPELRKTRQALCLMFQFCGMAFVDFAHLKKENVRGGVLEYKRQKTGTPMLIEVQSTAWESLRELSSDVGKDSPYLFPFLKGIKVGKEAYKEYTSALAHFNRNLKRLARACGVSIPITSYSIRHSFAMILKEQDVPIEMISELLGHKSIKTTQIYLKSFSLEKMSAVNKICFESVYNHVPKVGEICTSLINDAFPLIRYRSNDVIELYEGNEFGENEVLIQRIEGRKEDYLIGKHGEICQRLNQIAKKAHHSKAMQMIQDKRGQVSVYIVPDGEFTKSDEIQFVLAFEELVGVGVLDYSIYLVSSIKDLTYTKRGKFKMVINNIINKKP